MGFENKHKSQAERLKDLGLVEGSIDEDGNQVDLEIIALIEEVKLMQDYENISPEAKEITDGLIKRLSST
jgi:hypothetical protein